jgi:hypothetical protein
MAMRPAGRLTSEQKQAAREHSPHHNKHRR